MTSKYERPKRPKRAAPKKRPRGLEDDRFSQEPGIPVRPEMIPNWEYRRNLPDPGPDSPFAPPSGRHEPGPPTQIPVDPQRPSPKFPFPPRQRPGFYRDTPFDPSKPPLDPGFFIDIPARRPGDPGFDRSIPLPNRLPNSPPPRNELRPIPLPNRPFDRDDLEPMQRDKELRKLSARRRTSKVKRTPKRKK